MPAEPSWMKIARSYLGEREVKGPKHNSKIVQFWIDMKASFRDDETAWCGAFVGGVLAQAGFKPFPQGASARAWRNFGYRLAKPAVGCIVVFWRGSPNGFSGHVGFVVGKDQAGNLMVLGGNQGDMISIKPFDDARVLGYVYPADPRTASYVLPTYKSDGRLSTNEA